MQCNTSSARHQYAGSSLRFSKKSKTNNCSRGTSASKLSGSQKLPADSCSTTLDGDAGAIQSLKKTLQNCAFCLAVAAAIALPNLLPNPSILAAEWVAAIADNVGVNINAGLPSKDDAEGLLRSSLPIHNKPIREIQTVLERTYGDLAVTTDDVKTIPGTIEKTMRHAAEVLEQSKEEILADISEGKTEKGQQLLNRLAQSLQDFQIIVENDKEINTVHQKHKELLHIVSNIEEMMVKEFPFEVPEEFASKPLLKGRATIEIKVRLKDNPNVKTASLKAVLDGYSAPVTAGNFLDLVERHFYDGMEIQKADGFVVQTGDPDGPSEGFVDPSTGRLRTIPLEIMVNGDEHPIYNATLEELGRETEQTKLPMKSCCPLLMARTEAEKNSASSQIIFLLNEAGANEALKSNTLVEESNSKESELDDKNLKDTSYLQVTELKETVPRKTNEVKKGMNLDNDNVNGHMSNGTIPMEIPVESKRKWAELETSSLNQSASSPIEQKENELNALLNETDKMNVDLMEVTSEDSKLKGSKNEENLPARQAELKEHSAANETMDHEKEIELKESIANETEFMHNNLNIKDGCNSVFGYVTENEGLLADLKVGDVIESIRVTSGLENLANPSYR